MGDITFKEQFQEQIATADSLHTSHLYILSFISETDLKIFQEIWPTISIKRRRDVMQELVDIGEANFEVNFDPVFLLGLGDADADVRTSAINGLWENQNPALIVPFVHLLQADEAPIVRAAAAIALGRFLYLSEIEKLDPQTVAPARAALLDTIYQPVEDVEVRRRAVESVAYLSEDNITNIIENAYYDSDEKMQVSAIFAMGRSCDTRWRSTVVEELDNHNTEIRFEAARASGELEAKAAIPKLIDLLEEDDDVEVQQMCIWALGRIGGPVAREVLEQYVESDNEVLSLAAEDALEEIQLFGDSFDMFGLDDEEWSDEFELDKQGDHRL